MIIKINDTKMTYLKKINKINKTLTRLINIKREDTNYKCHK